MKGRVNPDMVRLGRETRAMTQTELADKAGLSQGTISRVELGTIELGDDKAQAVADVLNYPLSFFYQDESYSGLGMSVVFYRKRASTLVKHMRQIEAEANIRRIHAKALLRDATLNTPNEFRVIEIDNLKGDAAAVAQMTRANWRVSSGPVKNLVQLIESAGGLVFRFPFGTRDIDAISQWPDDLNFPVFFVNSEADPDRTKFSLAHELGHMVMHRCASETMEDEADQFASEFLLPERDVKHDLYGMSLEKAASMKPHWRVSMAAIMRRAHDLGCMTDYRYRDVFMRYSRLGFRRREPNPLPIDEPRLFQKLIDAHVQQNGFQKEDFCRLFHLTGRELDAKYFAKNGLRLAL